MVMCLVTALGILMTEPEKLLSLYMMGYAFLYFICVHSMMSVAYSSDSVYPKPSQYCVFALRPAAFIRINCVYLLSRRLTFLIILTPVAYLLADSGSVSLNVFMFAISYVELIFLLVIGSVTFHFLASRGKSTTFDIIPAWVSVLFYIGYKGETVWPLLLNPFGTFLFAPVITSREYSSAWPGLAVVAVMVVALTLWTRRTLKDWPL